MNFFDEQDRARRGTRWLVIAYVFATLVIMAGVTAIVAAAFLLVGQPGTPADPSVLVATALLTAVLIAGATLFKSAALSSGGSQVAIDMGGTLVPPDIRDPLRQRLRNVVEEMAIASGIPAPEIFVLESEPGINAFAAGLTPGDAAIAVTRGALETLDRDELQGVIAHEFAHVLNGDMRLNLRMIGVLFGIMVLSLIGRMILRSGRHRSLISSRSNRNVPFVLVIGLGLTILGWIGVLSARIIKAGVSRQRELLADASAVQFTRQSRGLAGALKKIGGYSERSWFRAADPEQVSHMLFARGSKRFSSLLATHPPLVKRIQRLDPSFREEDFPRVEPRSAANDESRPGDRAMALAAVSGDDRTADDTDNAHTADNIVDNVGHPTPRQIDLARRLHHSIPVLLIDAVHSHEESFLLTLALTLHQDSSHRDRQLRLLLDQLGPQRTQRVARYDEELRKLGPSFYLLLLDIAFPALRRRPVSQLEFLLSLVRRLVETDDELDLREYCYLRILAGNLDLEMHSLRARHNGRLGRSGTASAARNLLRVVADHDNTVDVAKRDAAFAAGLKALGLTAGDLESFAAGRPTPAELDRSLDRLHHLKATERNRLIRAVSTVILHDGNISIAEIELLRAVCSALDCPLPPLAVANPLAQTPGGH
jgi:Zn-dependent protease with chaperone function